MAQLKDLNILSNLRQKLRVIKYFITLKLIIYNKHFIASIICNSLFFLATAKAFSQNTNPAESAVYDQFHRLVSYPEKIEVPCPRQTAGTGVLLIIGQSNAGNHGHERFKVRHPDMVVNYFNGKCFDASSPLLGASGPTRSFVTPLADALIDNGTFTNLVIIASAVSGSVVSRWGTGGDLNRMLISTIIEAKPTYRITDIIWHQGESDYQKGTAYKDYIASFRLLLRDLSAIGVFAPIFMSIATKVDSIDWRADNPISTAQRSLINGKSIILGVDTDSLIEDKDRYDGCHFKKIGQKKVADALAVSIRNSHVPYRPLFRQ